MTTDFTKLDLSLTSAELDHLARYGWALLALDKPQLAVTALAEVIDQQPGHPEYVAAYAVALAKAGRQLDACAAMRRALESQPGSIQLWCMLAELSLDLLDYVGAAAALEKCVELDPDAAHPSGLRARALIKKGHKLAAAARG